MTALPQVLSYPPRHPYVDRFHDRVATLAHRDEVVPRLPRFYDPAWLRRHHTDWDLVHYHFGAEAHGLDEVVAMLGTHKQLGKPIVVTVHDLTDPSLRPRISDTPRALRTIVPFARAVTTLTPTAADMVERICGTRPRVIPHGPVLPSAELWRARRQRAADAGAWGPVLVNAKPHRPGYDLDAVLRAATRVPTEVDIRVLVHHDDVEQIARHPAAPRLEVVAHDGLSQQDLVGQLAASRSLVLPYRRGTHSHLMELAADVGTPTIVADTGCHREQHPCWPVDVRNGAIDCEGLATAMASQPGPDLVRPPRDRLTVGDWVLSAHRRLYGAALSCGGVGIDDPIPQVRPAKP